MLDINHLRNNLKDVQDNLKKRGFVLDAKQFNSLDSERKLLQTETESLQEKSNILAKEISVERNQEAREQKLKNAKEISSQLKKHKSELDKTLERLNNFLLEIPNILSKDVPEGNSEKNNLVVYEKGNIPDFEFQIKDHQELGELYNGINFEESASIAKSRFVVLRKEIAKLHRALIQFMLDEHIKKGYEEIYVPYIVNASSLTGTGQLLNLKKTYLKLQTKKCI